MSTLADRIDALLPQTQCEQCGYHGCRPYAEAIARGDAEINQCPPGGSAGIAKLAALLGRDPLPLNPEHGVEKPRTLARIIEADCIGCTKCIQVCPVDAIVGSAKLMHTVISDIVCLNSGAALYAANVVDSIAAGIELARATIASGAARAKMDAFVAATRRLAEAS